MSDLLATAIALGTALAVGLVVGLERGWRARALAEGKRVAGLRTFALIGLLGGLLSLPPARALLEAAGLVSIALIFAVSYRQGAESAGSVSITTAIAAFVTFALGAVAVRGQPAIALAGAVVVALLLDLKDELHGWLRGLEPAELKALLQLGVLTAVVLPLLPNAGFGPYQALNPFKLWLAVILVASLSLAGHVASRLGGAQHGLLWTGLLGGLASSTAATLSLSRVARGQPRLARTASAGILAASAMMFLRMAIVVSALEPALSVSLGGYLALLSIAAFAITAWAWHRREPDQHPTTSAQAMLFDLRTAIGFGAALGIVTVLARAAKEAAGPAGIYGVAFAAGLADVDAIVISSVQLHAQGQLAAAQTSVAILLAACANMVVKAAMAWVIGGRAVGTRVAAGYGATLAAGLVVAAVRLAASG